VPEGRHRVEVWAYPYGQRSPDGIDNVYGTKMLVCLDVIYPPAAAC
jgi:hypothetical protein